MEHAADTWPEHAHDERRTARLLAALAVSVLCHATVLLLVRGWRLEADVAPPLVVTMVERGSGGPGSDAASGPEPAAAAPVPVAVAAAPPTRPVAERVPARRPVAPTTRTAAPAVESAAPVAARDESHAVAPGGADAGTSGIGGGAASPGSGGAGHGGSGGGSDGLRALCARCPAPEYPSRARRQGWQGTVDVELAIAGDGAVAEARIGRSSGYPTLDEVALEVARRSRFTVPTDNDGLRGQLRYRFVLDETAARR